LPPDYKKKEMIEEEVEIDEKEIERLIIEKNNEKLKELNIIEK